MDDWNVTAVGTFEEACGVARQAVKDIENLGWLINFEKSCLTPAKRMKWLGVLIDSILMRLFMPGEKVVKLEEKIKEFVETGSMTAFRELAEIAGTLLSMGVAIIPVRMILQELFKLTRPSEWEAGWETTMPKMEEMTSSMKFWIRVEDGGEGKLRKWNAVGSDSDPA